jgi:nitroreductase
MDALEAIHTRRSIRRYTAAPVNDAEVHALVHAAMCAPSAFGQRSTRFVVVRDQAVRDILSQASQYAGMVADSPVAIVVCGDTRVERLPGAYWVHDGVAALENMLTAAHAIGLGAVWVGVHPFPERMDAVREAVGLPEGVEPLATVAVGRPGEHRPVPDRFDASHVHAERW